MTDLNYQSTGFFRMGWSPHVLLKLFHQAKQNSKIKSAKRKERQNGGFVTQLSRLGWIVLVPAPQALSLSACLLFINLDTGYRKSP